MTAVMVATVAEAAAPGRRNVRLAILAVIVLVASAAAIAMGMFGRNAASMTTIGGPFTLTTQSGARLSDSDLAGTPFAVFFGFTHCPEVCPTTLWEMSEALKALGPDADRLKVLFISVDPGRDTVELLASYLQSFDPMILGLTGTEAEIEAVGKAYRAYWRKIATEGGDYTMDHTASIFLMDRNGEFVGTIAYQEEPQVRLRKLRQLIDGGRT